MGTHPAAAEGDEMPRRVNASSSPGRVVQPWCHGKLSMPSAASKTPTGEQLYPWRAWQSALMWRSARSASPHQHGGLPSLSGSEKLRDAFHLWLQRVPRRPSVPKGMEAAATAIPLGCPPGLCRLPARATRVSRHLHPFLAARASSSPTSLGAPGDAGAKMDWLLQTDAKLSPSIFFLKEILLC